jgi:ceramide glucosyltransferase
MNLNLTFVDCILLIFCLVSIWFYCYAIYAGIARFGNPTPIDPNFHPSVTILKPICGLDRNTYENLASFCQQVYSEYQIIFAVREAKDPCIQVVHDLIDRFPNVDIQLVVSDLTIGENLKVSNLANAVGSAKHAILIIADSDIRVEPDYLQRVIQPLNDPRIGVVTCPYRSLACGWAATLEAISTATEFQPGVLVSNKLEGIRFALGSTIAIRKEVLDAIGGFPAIADYLADDFLLGNLANRFGYKVVLSDYVVEHVLANTSLVESIQHQLRWSRCIRVSRPWGYLGLIFTYGTATSLLFWIATGGSMLGNTVLGITWLSRLTMAWIVGVKCLNDSSTAKYLWLVPLRDLLSFVVWCCSFFGNTINWRGRKLKLTKEGKLVPIQAHCAKVAPTYLGSV